MLKRYSEADLSLNMLKNYCEKNEFDLKLEEKFKLNKIEGDELFLFEKIELDSKENNTDKILVGEDIVLGLYKLDIDDTDTFEKKNFMMKLLLDVNLSRRINAFSKNLNVEKASLYGILNEINNYMRY